MFPLQPTDNKRFVFVQPLATDGVSDVEFTESPLRQLRIFGRIRTIRTVVRSRQAPWNKAIRKIRRGACRNSYFWGCTPTHLLIVLPDGRIFPCPDMMYDASMQMGEIHGNWLKPSPLQLHPAMPCEACEAFS